MKRLELKHSKHKTTLKAQQLSLTAPYQHCFLVVRGIMTGKVANLRVVNMSTIFLSRFTAEIDLRATTEDLSRLENAYRLQEDIMFVSQFDWNTIKHGSYTGRLVYFNYNVDVSWTEPAYVRIKLNLKDMT